MRTARGWGNAAESLYPPLHVAQGLEVKIQLLLLEVPHFCAQIVHVREDRVDDTHAIRVDRTAHTGGRHPGRSEETRERLEGVVLRRSSGSRAGVADELVPRSVVLIRHCPEVQVRKGRIFP